MDGGTLRPVGRMAGKPEYDDEGQLLRFTPANFVLAHGKINGRRVVIGGEDFTIAGGFHPNSGNILITMKISKWLLYSHLLHLLGLPSALLASHQRPIIALFVSGGSPNTAGLKKSIATEKEALRFRCPLVRLHEGGGGSVGGNKKADSRDTNARLADGGDDSQKAAPAPLVEEGAPPTPKKPGKGRQHGGDGGNVFAENRFSSVGEVLAAVPVACAAMGAVAGLPASRFVASHFTVMTPNAQVLVAGPRVVERAWEGTVKKGLTKEELGCEQHA